MLRWVLRESTAEAPEGGPSLTFRDTRVPSLPHSLPELLLRPSRRFEEYGHLLCALRLHAPAEHADRGPLATALDQIRKYQGYIDQVGC